MTISLLVAVLGFVAGVAWSPWPGIHVAVVVLSVASAAKTAWLGWAVRGSR